MKKVGFFQSIRLKIVIIYILLLLLAIQVIGSYFALRLEDNLKENFDATIEERIDGLTYYLEQAFQKERPEDEEGPTLEEDVQNILNRVDSGVFSTLQVLDRQYRVVGAKNVIDSNIIGSRITGDPRITRAFIYGQEENSVVRDPETNKRMKVRILPIGDEDEPVGILYIEASMEGIYEQLASINDIFAKGTGLAVAISAILGILVARTITKPITEMRKQAKIVSTGDFSQKVNVYGTDEIGQLATTFNDMNDKLKQAHLATEGERRKLSSVLSNMSDGVIATDETGKVTLMNEPALYLMRKEFDQVKGKPLIEVLHLEDEITDDIQTDTGSVTIDFSDDEEFYLIKANFSVIQDEDGKIGGFITVISDVTEQEKVEKERREFVSNVSHELRTPLTTMRSYLEALTDGAWEDKEIAPKFLDVTQNETDRMIRLVNDLLQLSKMDNKTTDLYMERVNFITFFHNIIDRFEMNKADDIILNRQLPNSESYVWIDKDKMTQVIDNIISNAIKYSPGGGTLTFNAAKNRNKLTVSVSDEGMGIAQEKVDKIFDRFYRADKARSRNLGGTGLGLAIAKEIIEAHHGQIWAESKEGKGTTVYFTLPLIKRSGGDKR
ncbi:cell wall metabolism sensor histidine kinase WalK [Sediminibacillus albus]|uniref:histidine kinase n=1 Tax=Sediminibacillus albus TaxID=407036 RepID=A0A1G9A6F0_9BACI|nr:cell wall metabolism sensor histidine kinase WalK [Sediminibacillus albus]SDK22454.1 two-component system, OmpR family, sensor histidine kinase VicK [Sediminibacillus albus]